MMLSRRQSLLLGIGGACAMAASVGKVGTLVGGGGLAQDALSMSDESVLGYIMGSVNKRQGGSAAPLAAVGAPLADGLRDTGHQLHLVFSVADASLVSEGDTIDGLWAQHNAGWLVSGYDWYVPVFEVDGCDEYVAFAIQQKYVDSGFGRPFDHVFALDDNAGHVLDGCDLDYERGIAYLPRDVFDDESVGVCLQVALVGSTEQGLSCLVPWQYWVGSRLVGEGSVEVSDLDVSFAIELPDEVDLSELSVRVFGESEPLDLSSCAYLEGCVLTLCVPLPCVCGIRIERKASLLEGVGAMFALARAWAVSGDAMRAWPYGYLLCDPGLKLNAKTNFRGWYIYPSSDFGENDVVHARYNALRSYLYWWTQGTFNATTAMNLDQVADEVLEAPHTPNWWGADRDMEQGDAYRPIYWGQLLSMVGADDSDRYGNGDYKSADWPRHNQKAYWATMVGGWDDDGVRVYQDASGGMSTHKHVVPTMCHHRSADYGSADLPASNVWRQCVIDVKITKVSLDDVTGSGYVVLDLMSEEYGLNPENGSGQGCMGIYKVPVRGGALRVRKTVTGDGADTNKAFTFHVKVSGVPGGVTAGTYGDVTLNANGEGTFTLKHGQTKTIKHLPAGASYVLTEDSADGYAASWSGASGTIADGTVKDAVCTNKREIGSVRINKGVDI